ncbi:Retrovirus-related Pol polyprotein from transposon 17.6 [Eumeta japonica]|uniref:Retrovirus-related Pol polyprotein from transposon 17.6 n=1 Tax=Eumeta variegata TaxID=151549 RepID=A0A4C1Y9E8_EUMVA|nr:Retrovirus-related Pol polyprotein from transposon 17.6 [Eumeta japonica]
MSKIIKPLTNLTKKAEKFIITDEVKRAFKQSKDLLTNAPILSYPDYNSTFTLTTDASDKALGAVLPEPTPIAYASRTLSETETLQHNKRVVSSALGMPTLPPEPNAKLTRWRLRLQKYDYDIKHTKGRENKVADALSRIELQNNESNAATVHSNNDDDETGIPIVDGFAHSRKNRIFLQESPTPKWRRDKNDVYIKIPLVNFDTELSKNWKKYIDPKKTDYAVVTICQRNKYERRPPKTPLEYTITPEAPLQIWHIDTLVIDGTQYLTAIDKFTKYFAAEKIEGNDSISYIRSLTKIIKYLGKPKHVIHDPDKLMNSLTFKEHLTNLLSIDVHQTSIRHHTSNGDIERAHSTIIEKYRVIRELHPGEDKEELMALTITCYNSTEHSVTKCTPHQALFGIEPNQIEIPDEAILVALYAAWRVVTTFEQPDGPLIEISHGPAMKERLQIVRNANGQFIVSKFTRIDNFYIVEIKDIFNVKDEKSTNVECPTSYVNTKYIPATFHDVNTAVCNTSKTKEVRPRDLCKDAPRCPDEPNKEAFNDARWMTGHVGHPRPPSASHAPQTPMFQTKEP